MKHTLDFKLVREAKRGGGDRYEYGTKGNIDWTVFYVPQMFSRVAGMAKGRLNITIEHVGVDIE